MGLFGKLFEKKECSICGGEIGLLGNRKLEDGNMCKTCAAKLSPWFSDRRSSTVEQIQEQLAYREANQDAVAAFNITRVLGDYTKVYLDEDARKFMVTRDRDLKEANPDVLDFSQVTGVEIDIDEDRDEEMRENHEGERVSYNPPRYFFRYNFKVIIRVNHPYFDDMEFDLNSGYLTINSCDAQPMMRKPDPRMYPDYRQYEEMAYEIKEVLTTARQQVRAEAAAAAAPKAAVTCPWCGATTMPDAKGCCEFCGGALNG